MSVGGGAPKDCPIQDRLAMLGVVTHPAGFEVGTSRAPKKSGFYLQFKSKAIVDPTKMPESGRL
jgi:hypothetical protein